MLAVHTRKGVGGTEASQGAFRATWAYPGRTIRGANKHSMRNDMCRRARAHKLGCGSEVSRTLPYDGRSSPAKTQKPPVLRLQHIPRHKRWCRWYKVKQGCRSGHPSLLSARCQQSSHVRACAMQEGWHAGLTGVPGSTITVKRIGGRDYSSCATRIAPQLRVVSTLMVSCRRRGAGNKRYDAAVLVAAIAAKSMSSPRPTACN